MRRQVLTLCWFASDVLVYAGAYALAYRMRVGQFHSTDFPFDTYMGAVWLTVPAWLFVMITMRNFALSRQQATLRNIAYITYACVIGMAAFALVFYFLRATLFSRLLLLSAGVFSSVLVFIWHIMFDQIQRSVLRSGNPTYPLLVIGTNREAANLVETLQRKKSPFTPVAVLDGRGAKVSDLSGVPVLGKLNKLEEVIKEKGITHLVQCDQLEQNLNLLSACTQLGITYFLLPSLLGIVQQQENTMHLEGKPVVAVEHHSRWQWFFR